MIIVSLYASILSQLRLNSLSTYSLYWLAVYRHTVFDFNTKEHYGIRISQCWDALSEWEPRD